MFSSSFFMSRNVTIASDSQVTPWRTSYSSSILAKLSLSKSERLSKHTRCSFPMSIWPLTPAILRTSAEFVTSQPNSLSRLTQSRMTRRRREVTRSQRSRRVLRRVSRLCYCSQVSLIAAHSRIASSSIFRSSSVSSTICSGRATPTSSTVTRLQMSCSGKMLASSERASNR